MAYYTQEDRRESMYSFTNDYSEGAHPKLLEALVKTNLEQSEGYGLDTYCLKASQALKKIVEKENVDIHYLVGGTQVNLTFISSVLRPYQAAIAVDSGHIFVHEAGSIEATGHKVITRPHKDGKLTVEMITSILKEHPDEHMVQPKLVYISQTTEYGSVYTTKELEEIYQYCKKNNLYLFIDGARLGSALALEKCPSLKQIANCCDAFYIGGTKMGALFGECLVIINDSLKENFRYHMKQKGALLAKGRLLGIQFLELFTNDLYLEIGKHENKMADMLKQGISNCGYSFYIESKTNQLFPIFTNSVIKQLKKQFEFHVMDTIDDHHTCIRLVTSWATNRENVEEFIKVLETVL